MICDSLRGKFKLGNLVVCWGNKPYRQSVREVFSFGRNSSRVLEINSVGEKFSEIETLAGNFLDPILWGLDWGSSYEKDFMEICHCS